MSKRQQPFFYVYQCYQQRYRILQMIFFRLHPCLQTGWFCQQFVEVAYLSNYCRPSFSIPAKKTRWQRLLKYIILFQN